MKGIKVEEYLVMGSSDTKQCVGYDRHEQTLMVPQQDTNSVNFTVPKNLTVDLAPADPTMVTISPSTITGDGQKHRLTLNPGTKVSNHATDDTFLMYKGNKYPAKTIRGLAYKIANNETLGSDQYSGGMDTVKFFERYGFPVEHAGNSIAEKKKVK